MIFTFLPKASWTDWLLHSKTMLCTKGEVRTLPTSVCVCVCVIKELADWWAAALAAISAVFWWQQRNWAQWQRDKAEPVCLVIWGSRSGHAALYQHWNWATHSLESHSPRRPLSSPVLWSPAPSATGQGPEGRSSVCFWVPHDSRSRICSIAWDYK